MKAAIIDDLPQCWEEIRSCLNRYFTENYAGETPVIEAFESGEEFLARFLPDRFDLIFIDQYMNELSGIATAEKIREQDKLAALIFVTTSRDHAVESYGVRACGYLVKPFFYENFVKTMELADLEKIRNARFIRVEGENILLREILWCDRDEHYVQIHTDRRGVLRFRLSAGEFAGLLSPYPQFLNCYKGCIINMERAERMDDACFLMDDGERVPFSGQKKKELEAKFLHYTFQREREDGLL